MVGSSSKRTLRSRARRATCCWPRSLILHLILPARAGSSWVKPAGGDLDDLSKEARIIGGSLAEEDRYPYAVSMFLNGKFGCAGSLIGKDTVLTAAHCLTRGKAVTVGVGSDAKDDGHRMTVRKVVMHPEYDDVTDEYDVGLLFLENSTTLDIAIPRLNADDSFPVPGSTANVMGWGDTDDSAERKVVSDELMIVDLDVISNEDCREAEGEEINYRSWIFDDMLCTHTEGHDACQGDSGGPLIIRGDGPETDVIVGVVSWGVGCNFLPGVFSRISASRDWIQETACELSNNPPGGLCADDAADSPGPTPSPSETPTSRPSPDPSWSPTETPTYGPSMGPTTEEPTPSPTLSPTLSPTSSPSLSGRPTGRPSERPTASSRPTTGGTEPPSTSARPTAAPSAGPSDPPNETTTSPSGASSGVPSRPRPREEQRKVGRIPRSTPDAFVLPEEEKEANDSVGMSNICAFEAWLSSIMAMAMWILFS